MKDYKNPPFDESEACPACPIEIRNLMACATNAINAWKNSSPERFERKLKDLENAINYARPIFDAHFSDSLHADGKIRRK